MEQTPYQLHSVKTILWANTSTMGLTIANFLSYSEHSQGFVRQEQFGDFFFLLLRTRLYNLQNISSPHLKPIWRHVLIFEGVEEHLPPRINWSVSMILPDTVILYNGITVCIHSNSPLCSRTLQCPIRKMRVPVSQKVGNVDYEQILIQCSPEKKPTNPYIVSLPFR